MKRVNYLHFVLTAIAVLLLLMVLQTGNNLTTPAFAEKDEQQRARQERVNVTSIPDLEMAVREVAASNKEIASALQQLSVSVDKIARAIDGVARAQKQQ